MHSVIARSPCPLAGSCLGSHSKDFPSHWSKELTGDIVSCRVIGYNSIGGRTSSCRKHWSEPREGGRRRESCHVKSEDVIKSFPLSPRAKKGSKCLLSSLGFCLGLFRPGLPGCLRLMPGLWQAFMRALPFFLEVKCSIMYVCSSYIISQCY